MDSYVTLALAIFGAIFVTRSDAFNPPGAYDLGPADLNALCPMIREFADTGKIPKSQKIVQATVNKDECVYFKWHDCPGKPDLKNPCGNYQMVKCPETKGKRDLWGETEPERDDSMPEAEHEEEPALLEFQNDRK